MNPVLNGEGSGCLVLIYNTPDFLNLILETIVIIWDPRSNNVPFFYSTQLKKISILHYCIVIRNRLTCNILARGLLLAFRKSTIKFNQAKQNGKFLLSFYFITET